MFWFWERRNDNLRAAAAPLLAAGCQAAELFPGLAINMIDYFFISMDPKQKKFNLVICNT